MISGPVYFWKQTPFIRLLVPLIAGIIVQWYGQLPVMAGWALLLTSLIFINLFSAISFFRRFQLSWLNGIGVMLLFIAIGSLLAWYQDVRHTKKWFADYLTEDASIIVSLDEPLVEKTKSLKAEASVRYILSRRGSLTVKGRIILYFKKDSVAPSIGYASQIILKKSLQEIRNSGNPGGFDYKRYSLFQGITHQVYLRPGEYKVLQAYEESDLKGILYATREKVLDILRTNVNGDKEAGLAEALLVGYKDDLDKTLVQSYSNTGVVHIIAISGMHLALIYGLINLLLKQLAKRKKWRWVKPVIALIVLWSFSLLTGASASVLRAAVMFTFIVFADSFSRKSNIYNTLAASAFCLLCYNPYWLWDVGFQLSYAAVLSIVVFMKPIYNVFYFRNKLLDHVWKLNAVTFAAQLLTTPLSIYYFHQFPVYFFLTNFIAVPLSSIILIGEILLCAVSFVPFLASLSGNILSWLIGLMNGYVEQIESLPGSLWDGLQINIVQAILLFIVIAGFSFWLLEKTGNGLKVGLAALLAFFMLRAWSFIGADQQRAIIVYNVPQRRAIDVVDGRNYLFCGDAELMTDDLTKNFHLKPSRVAHRVSPVLTIPAFVNNEKYIITRNVKILLVDSSVSFVPTKQRATIDLLIISKNPRLYITELDKRFEIKQVVFDGSVPFWKLTYWKKDCDSLHIPYHDVSEKGAFVMNLN